MDRNIKYFFQKINRNIKTHKSKKITLYVLVFTLLFILLGIIISLLSLRYEFGFFVTNSILNKQVVLIDKQAKLESLTNKIVYFDFPFDSPYFKKGTNFAKIVKCEAGDTLINKDKKFYCNDLFIAKALNTDSKGIPVKDFQFSGVIPQDKYFVIGENVNSYDSRYWGFLDKKNIKGISVWSY